MALTFTAGTSVESTGSVTTITVALPAGMTDGDYTICAVSLNASTGTIDTPAGWTEILPDTQGTASTSVCHAIFYRKWVTGDGDVVITHKSGRVAGTTIRVRGAHVTTFVDVSATVTQAAGGATTIEAPTITPSSGWLVCTFSGRHQTNGGVLTPFTNLSAGMTAVAEASGKATTQTNAGHLIAFQAVTPASATGTRQANPNLATTGAMGVSFSLNEAPTGGPGDVSAVVATATSQEGTPVVTGQVALLHVAATASATDLVPTVSAASTVTAVRAQGSSVAIAPAVSAAQSATVIGVIAQASSLAYAPAVAGERVADVAGVVATASAASPPPVVDTPASVAAVVSQGSSTAIAPAVSNGSGGTLFSSISDTFDDGTMAAIWSSSYGGVSEAGGHGRILSTTGFPAFKTAAVYTLAGSHALVQAFPAIKGTSTGSVTSEMLIDSPTGGTRLLVIANTGTNQISFRNDVGYGDGSGVTIAYDATAHAWWRIRESAGTVYMDTAPDGLTWTNRRSFATPAWVTTGNNPLVFSTHRNDGDLTHYFEFDNFNSAPTTVPGNVSAVPATGSSAAVAPVVGGGAVVVALASTATATDYVPGVSAGTVLFAPDSTASGDAHNPTVLAGVGIASVTATASGDMLNPVVSTTAGAVVSAPAMLATTGTPEPVVTSAATVQSASISASAQATPPSVSVTAGVAVAAPVMQATTATPEPVVGTAATIQSVRATAGAQATPPAVAVVVTMLAMRMVATATARTPGVSVAALVNAVAALATAVAQAPRLGGDSELYLKDGTRVLPFLLIGGILVPVDTQF